MENGNSSSSVYCPPETSHRDELLMQQSLLFSDSLKDLKNLRQQLYSAAEYFERSYAAEDDDQQIAIENIKDYVIKALVNTLDHMGSVAYKINSFLDEKVAVVSVTELKLSCIEQRLRTCECVVDQGGMFQQSLVLNFPKHHKRYILPGKPGDDLHRFVNASQVTSMESAKLTTVRNRRLLFESPQSSPAPFPFQFIRSVSTKLHEKRDSSPLRFSLIRSGSIIKRSTKPNSSSAKQQPLPQRSASIYNSGSRDMTTDMEQYVSNTKRIFKAFLSMRKSNKSAVLFNHLDDK